MGVGALVLNNSDSNTAVSATALLLNTTGNNNTAVGTDALVFNDSGLDNTAVGFQALFSNTSGSDTAVGAFALFMNTDGTANTAVGLGALQNNTGFENTATGGGALTSNTTGSANTAYGVFSLENNTTGSGNTALGTNAGQNATGDGNVYIGAGLLGNGDGNVYIGAGMSGVAGESNQTYIRNINTTSVSGAGTDTVTVNLSTGLLGHVTSSRRYKQDIRSMDNASHALFALKPVTFRYKKEIDQSQSLEYGLVAEDVAQIDPNLAIRNKNGQIENVRYSAMNAMLLNEFLKEHQALVEEQRKVQRLEATLEAVNQRLKEQEAKIERVSAQLEMSKPAPQVVRVPWNCRCVTDFAPSEQGGAVSSPPLGNFATHGRSHCSERRTGDRGSLI